MVASMKGNVDVVAKLLEYHCDPNLQDVHGTTALMEAVKHNHEDVCSILLASGAHLSLCESQAASTLCQAVFDGDTMLLRRLLKANIQVNAGKSLKVLLVFSLRSNTHNPFRSRRL